VVGEDGLLTIIDRDDPETMAAFQMAEPGDSIFRDGFRTLSYRHRTQHFESLEKSNTICPIYCNMGEPYENHD